MAAVFGFSLAERKTENKRKINLVVAPQPLKGGALNVFLATTDKLEEPGDDPNQPPTQYAMLQIAVDGAHSQKLREDSFADLESRALWAADGSGALVEQAIDPATGRGKLLWVPADGAPPVELPGELGIANVRWGP